MPNFKWVKIFKIFDIMFKAGDDVQALDGKEWYNAKVIRVSIEIFINF